MRYKAPAYFIMLIIIILALTSCTKDMQEADNQNSANVMGQADDSNDAAQREDETAEAEVIGKIYTLKTLAENKHYTLQAIDGRPFVYLQIPQDQWQKFTSNQLYGKLPSYDVEGITVSPEWTRLIYGVLEDHFDYIVFILNTPEKPAELLMNGFYQPVSNQVTGIGTPYFGTPTYDFTDLYVDSVDQLKGIVYITHNDVIYDGPILHELMHHYGNYLIDTDYGMTHWGDANIAGRLGGFTAIQETEEGNTTITGSRVYWSGPYASLELYLMGLISKDEVPDITVITEDYSTRIIEKSAWNRRDGEDILVEGKIVTKDYTIEEIINGDLSDDNQAKGADARIPDYTRSQKEFNALFVIIDYDKMTDDEIDSVSDQIDDLCYAGQNDDHIYNYWEATYGKGILNATVIRKTP